MLGLWYYFLCLVTGYFAGAIPFAVIISRFKGVDIFSVGSGNPGATNVLRALGKPYGYACFLLDALKGVAAVMLGGFIAMQFGLGESPGGIIGLIGAILGHSYSIFLKFRGGKGVATTAGGMFALMPIVALIGAAVWLVVFFTSRFVSLASICLGLSLPISSLLIHDDPRSFGLCLFIAVLIVVRHRANIQRLMAGSENRTGRKK